MLWLKDLMMTKYEVKQEYKQDEGDPHDPDLDAQMQGEPGGDTSHHAPVGLSGYGLAIIEERPIQVEC